ncbi:MAG: hypothetical protein ACRC5T_10710 [Cetobacterium sp.]
MSSIDHLTQEQFFEARKIVSETLITPGLENWNDPDNLIAAERLLRSGLIDLRYLKLDNSASIK